MNVIGQLIGTEERSRDWRELVLALDEAARPGGPLEGYVFHGTDRLAAEVILREGMEPTAAIAQTETDGPWLDARGTHWGTPKVAAFYAEDLIESRENPLLDLAIIAVRIDDLAPWGAFAVDGQTIDCPLHSRLDRSEAETWSGWDASSQDWQACLEHFGTLLVLGAVPPHVMRGVASLDDLERLCAASAPPHTP